MKRKNVVRGGGLEPPHHCWRQDLNLVRLPISPSSRDENTYRQKNRHKSKGRPTISCRPKQVLVAFQLQLGILADFLTPCLIFLLSIHFFDEPFAFCTMLFNTQLEFDKGQWVDVGNRTRPCLPYKFNLFLHSKPRCIERRQE